MRIEVRFRNLSMFRLSNFRLNGCFVGSNSNSRFRLYPVPPTKTVPTERCPPAPYNCGERNTLHRCNTLITIQHFQQGGYTQLQPHVSTSKVSASKSCRSFPLNTSIWLSASEKNGNEGWGEGIERIDAIECSDRPATASYALRGRDTSTRSEAQQGSGEA